MIRDNFSNDFARTLQKIVWESFRIFQRISLESFREFYENLLEDSKKIIQWNLRVFFKWFIKNLAENFVRILLRIPFRSICQIIVRNASKDATWIFYASLLESMQWFSENFRSFQENSSVKFWKNCLFSRILHSGIWFYECSSIELTRILQRISCESFK